MATQTTHYSLIKPAYDEAADIETINDNMDIIDTQLYNANNAVRAVNKGGTGASTEAAARSNLGLGSVLSDVSDLQDALGIIKMVRKSVPASGSESYTFSSACSYVILVTGVSSTTRGILFGYCNASGNVTVTKMDAGSTNNISTTTASYKLTINNAYSSGCTAVMIVMGGTAPT